VAALGQRLDRALSSCGFSRPPASSSYKRPVPAGVQALHVDFALRPRYFPGALTHLRPRITFQYSSLNALALSMGLNPLVAGHDGITLNQPFELLVPEHEPLVASAISDLPSLVSLIASRFDTTGRSFCDD
jgi:hypothetical protein